MIHAKWLPFFFFQLSVFSKKQFNTSDSQFYASYSEDPQHAITGAYKCMTYLFARKTLCTIILSDFILLSPSCTILQLMDQTTFDV